MNHLHLDHVQDLAGFVAQNTLPGDKLLRVVSASLTSDDPDFYPYIDQLSNAFLSANSILANAVYQFLVIIHPDLSAELYVNEFPAQLRIRAKKSLPAGHLVRYEDIADIERLTFPGITIAPTDSVIYCCKVRWKFGLYFDLTRELDVNAMELDLRALNRYLSFQHVYKVLESEAQFSEMLQDGWFPFIEMLGRDHKELSAAYADKFNFDSRVVQVLGRFDRARIDAITSRWWGHELYRTKRSLLEAGVNAYLRDDAEGFIHCIKTLLPELEGIIQFLFFHDTGKGARKSHTLIQHVIGRGRAKSGDDFSLFLPAPFQTYLTDVVFAGFDLTTGALPLSRHSTSHGVADAAAYTKARALQTILTLDQVHWYL